MRPELLGLEFAFEKLFGLGVRPQFVKVVRLPQPTDDDPLVRILSTSTCEFEMNERLSTQIDRDWRLENGDPETEPEPQRKPKKTPKKPPSEFPTPDRKPEIEPNAPPEIQPDESPEIEPPVHNPEIEPPSTPEFER